MKKNLFAQNDKKTVSRSGKAFCKKLRKGTVLVLAAAFAVCALAGCGSSSTADSSSDSSSGSSGSDTIDYENAEIIDVYGEDGEEVVLQYSFIEADSSAVTEENLTDWYYNYVAETDYNWYVICYTDSDEDDLRGVYCFSDSIEVGVALAQYGTDLYLPDEEDGDYVTYIPSDDGSSLEITENEETTDADEEAEEYEETEEE